MPRPRVVASLVVVLATAAALDTACELRITGSCPRLQSAPLLSWFQIGFATRGASCQQRKNVYLVRCGGSARLDVREVPVLSFPAAERLSLELRSSSLPPERMVPRCVRHMLEGCSMWRRPRRFATSLTPLISMAYLIHHTKNVRRRAFQLKQLPRLGLPLTVVAGWDSEDISESDRACVLANGSTESTLLREHLWTRLGPSVGSAFELNSRPAGYLSQSIKLFAAVYDMLRRSDERPSLILEDDALLRYEVLPLVATALPLLVLANFSLCFVGSYSTNGHDSLLPGLKPRSAAYHRQVMPAVGVLTSRRAARHLLRSLPISASIDQTLSDLRVLSSPCRVPDACFYLKPFAVMPGVYSGRGLFGGEGLGASLDDSSRRGADMKPSSTSSPVIDATKQEEHASDVTNASWCCEQHSGSTSEQGDWRNGHFDWEKDAELRCGTPCLRWTPRLVAAPAPTHRLRLSVEKARLGIDRSAGAADRTRGHATREHASCLPCRDARRYTFHATISVAGGGKYAAD